MGNRDRAAGDGTSRCTVPQINPHSKWAQMWDSFAAITLLYVALAVPFEVAFLDDEIWSAAWFVARLIDLVFLVDICLSFITPFQDDARVWVTDPQRIASTYIKTWLFVDIVSIFPFEIIAMFNKDLATLRIIKIVKILRLVKLMRMFRLSKLFAKWESALEIDYRWLSLAKFVAVFLLAAHWMACMWHMVIVLQMVAEPEHIRNWITLYEDLHGAKLEGVVQKYTASLYFAVITVATIGYGDIVPATHAERLFVMLAAIAGGGLYAYLVGAVCGVIARMDEDSQAFTREIDLLNRFLRARNIPQPLCVKLRDYVHFRWKEKRARGAEVADVLQSMSSDLAAQVYTVTHVPILQQLRCFTSTSVEFLAALCSSFEVNLFSPEDMIIRSGKPVLHLHILERGMAMRAARVLKPYTVVGEEMLITSRPVNSGVICLTHVMTLSMSHGKYTAALRDYPAMAPIVRRNVVRDAVRQAVRPRDLACKQSLGTKAKAFGQSYVMDLDSGCHHLLQMLDCAKGIRTAVLQLMNPHSKTTRREIERNATAFQLQVLYDVKLFIDLADPYTYRKLRDVARVLEKTCKRIVLVKRVTALLEKQSHYHPAVLAMEHELQSHGLDNMLQAFLDDDHDPWTLSQCSAGDLTSKYQIPMGTAVRLLHSMRDSTTKDATGKSSLVQRKSSNRVVAHHVATAILSFLEVGELPYVRKSLMYKVLARKEAQGLLQAARKKENVIPFVSGLQHEKVQKMQRWAWGLVGSKRWQWQAEQTMEVRRRSSAAIGHAAPREARNYHLPSWLPSRSRVHVQPLSGEVDESITSMCTNSKPLDITAVGHTLISVTGKHGQGQYIESSGSEIDEDSEINIRKSDVPMWHHIHAPVERS